MKRPLCLILIAVALCGCSSFSRWKQYYEQGQDAEKTGNFGAAAEMYEHGLSDAKMFGVAPSEYLPLARARAHADGSPESWAGFVQAAKSVGDKRAVYDAYEGLAWKLRNNQRNLAAAQRVDMEAAAYCAEKFGAESIERAWFEMRVADVDVALGRPVQALQRLRQIEKIFRKTAPHNENNYLSTFLMTEAEAADAMHDGSSARAYYLEALALPFDSDPMAEDNLRRQVVGVLDKYGYKDDAQREYEEYIKAPSLPSPKPTYKQVVQGYI
jgi:hypothetical protein